MHTNRITVGFVTILVIACCLALGGFAPPALAKTIVVTTLTDVADPPFDADGPCGTGTVGDLPGADGLTSLREAIIAANNTSGADTITFNPSLSGGTIVVSFDDLDADTTPDPLPALCGGYTRIKGDLDSDDVPDITLEGAAFPIPAPPASPAVSAAAGISVISSHNTIEGLQVQHFPFGIRILAGDFTNPGTVEHTTVTNNILAESGLDGIFVATGDVPDSLVAHTTITHNLVRQNARFGIRVTVNLSGAGSDTYIAHTTITDNEVVENGNSGILMFPLGDHNIISDLTIARNMASGNAAQGINVFGGVNGADGNTVEVRIENNTVGDNGLPAIRMVAGQDNSSDNHIVARIQGNTVERSQLAGGILIEGGLGAVFFPTATSANNVVDVRIEQNMVKSQTGVGISITGGIGSLDGRAGAIADNNHVSAIVRHNVVEDSTDTGIQLAAGSSGLASANTLDVQVEKNTVCHNAGTDIHGEGGSSGSVLHPVPNQGAGNELAGNISKNTATTVTVADGTPGNTADVAQSKNVPCP